MRAICSPAHDLVPVLDPNEPPRPAAESSRRASGQRLPALPVSDNTSYHLATPISRMKFSHLVCVSWIRFSPVHDGRQCVGPAGPTPQQGQPLPVLPVRQPGDAAQLYAMGALHYFGDGEGVQGDLNTLREGHVDSQRPLTSLSVRT